MLSDLEESLPRRCQEMIKDLGNLFVLVVWLAMKNLRNLVFQFVHPGFL